MVDDSCQTIKSLGQLQEQRDTVNSIAGWHQAANPVTPQPDDDSDP